MMKNKIIFFVIGVLLIFILSCSTIPVNAVMPPHANLNLYYENQLVQDEEFYIKMLSCQERFCIYHQIISELESHENKSGVYKRCSEIAQRYNMTLEYCFNLIFCEKSYGKKTCEKFNHLELLPPNKNCCWDNKIISCSNLQCFFWRPIPDEFRLAIYIPSLDKMFVTDEISKTNSDSDYKVELFPNGIAKIYETTPPFNPDLIIFFFAVLLITLFLEISVAGIFLWAAKIPKKKILTSVIVVNLISFPILWFMILSMLIVGFGVLSIFSFLPFSGDSILVLTFLATVLFAIVFEAYFIHHFSKKIISLKKASILSIIMNLVSFFIGWLGLFVFAFFFAG
ncbi:MAG: hypothetical protein KAU95_00460 [Candidatus Aenigmarchaeota archaeon]|nr:hypothetical protein [Candidatus Aenigmarchaeota archaeon]